jgi:hypothetical protein
MSDIPLYHFLRSLLFPLHSGALVKSGPRQHKPTKVKIDKVYSMSTYAYDQGVMQ